MKHVIHIFGASGSGTSTLAKAVSERTGFLWMDTDAYYWLPGDTPYTLKRPVPERIVLMQRDIDAADNVVLSGSLIGWGDVFIPQFTLVVRLSVPHDARMDRLRKREYERCGDRILPGGDMYEQSRAFLEWAAAYDANTVGRCQKYHDDWQRTLPCPLLELDGTLPVETLCSLVIQAIQ